MLPSVLERTWLMFIPERRGAPAAVVAEEEEDGGTSRFACQLSPARRVSSRSSIFSRAFILSLGVG